MTRTLEGTYGQCRSAQGPSHHHPSLPNKLTRLRLRRPRSPRSLLAAWRRAARSLATSRPDCPPRSRGSTALPFLSTGLSITPLPLTSAAQRGIDARLISISSSDAPESDSVSLPVGSRYAKRCGEDKVDGGREEGGREEGRPRPMSRPRGLSGGKAEDAA